MLNKEVMADLIIRTQYMCICLQVDLDRSNMDAQMYHLTLRTTDNVASMHLQLWFDPGGLALVRMAEEIRRSSLSPS